MARTNESMLRLHGLALLSTNLYTGLVGPLRFSLSGRTGLVSVPDEKHNTNKQTNELN